MVHPDLDADTRSQRLWKDVEHICRLDDGRPRGGVEDPHGAAPRSPTRLTERTFRRSHSTGEGTDLTVGLLPSPRGMAATFSTADGLSHHPNLPTEEVFTTPDPQRVDGVVRSTKPLELDGTMVRGLRCGSRAAVRWQIDADSGAEVLRGRASRGRRARRGWARSRWSTARAASARWTRSSTRR